MTRKTGAALFSGGILVGALGLVLVQRINHPGDSGAVASPSETGPTDQVSALRAEYDQRIAALTTENEALQAEKKAFEEQAAKPGVNTPDATPPKQFTAEEVRKRSEEVREYTADARRKRDTENLLAAGYSMERIEYLRRRAKELADQFRQSQTDQLNKGVWPLDPKKDLLLGAVLGTNPDFALKYEIGDAEYERYLAALKRPTTMHVDDVSKGSIAAGVGIKPGDEIVTYNNERIFNITQLQFESFGRQTDTPGQLVPVTVRRNGQTMQVMVPRGPLGISQPITDMIDLYVPPPPPPPDVSGR